MRRILTMPQVGEMHGDVALFLSGGVMLGRDIDQKLPYPSDTKIHEPGTVPARSYLELAEAVYGPIRRPIGFSYVWGARTGRSATELH